MDTREKIVQLDELATLLTTNTWTIIAGFFDPLTVIQAKWLQSLCETNRKVAAVVLHSDNSLLSTQARAALVAALRSVDLVCVAALHDWQKDLPKTCNIRIIEDSEGEARRSAEFVQFVIDRQQTLIGRGALTNG